MIQFPADKNKQNVGAYFLEMRQNLVSFAKIFHNQLFSIREERRPRFVLLSKFEKQMMNIVLQSRLLQPKGVAWLQNFSRAGSSYQTLTLKLLTKEECQLCDIAKEQIMTNLDERLLAKFQIKEIDITEDGNEDLYDRWKWEIPVFYLEDKFLCKNRIDLELLKERIKTYSLSKESWIYSFVCIK